MFKSKKSKVTGLVLLALLLVSALGAKLYSDITMNDDDWIGLGYNKGRIVFDDQAVDEVFIMDADFGVGTSNPSGKFEVFSSGSLYEAITTSGTGYARTYYKRNGVWVGSIGAGDDGAFSLGAGSSASPDQLVLESDGDITMSDDLDVARDIRAAMVVYGEYMIAAHDLIATGGVYASEIRSSSNLLADHNVNATFDVTAGDDVVAGDDVIAYDDVKATGDVTSGGVITAKGDITAGYGQEDTGDVYGIDVVASDDVVAGDNVTAGEDVIADGHVWIGDANDLAAKSNMPSAAVVDGQGGYFFYTADVSEDIVLTGVTTLSTGTRRQVWFRWLVFDSTACTLYEGEDSLLFVGTTAAVSIAGEGPNGLLFKVVPGTTPNYHGYLYLDVVGNHAYEVSLLVMWQ